MSKEKSVVMMDSPEAATYKTGVSGWVSRDGLFFGKDERTARYSGCTHRLCEDCRTAVVDKHSLVCNGCRTLRDIAKYEKMPTKPWDGESPVFSDADGKYFFHGEFWDYLEDDDEQGRTAEDMRLVHCEPVHLRTIDEDYWQDELSTEDDSADVPTAVSDALDALNLAIRAAGPVAWTPGKFAVELPVRAIPGESEVGNG